CANGATRNVVVW
nr:immunoglobulin heavy chain junction region [Macaca mulatta]